DSGHDEFAAAPEKIRRGSAKHEKGRKALVIEGELIAKSTGTVSTFAVGERVFHQKFGNGNVVAVDGNKLTIAFDTAGEKRAVDSVVERVFSEALPKGPCPGTRRCRVRHCLALVGAVFAAHRVLTSSRDVVRRLVRDGFERMSVRGSHHKLVHAMKHR